MRIKGVLAREILNSRNEKTIEISVLTNRGNSISSAPHGKSRGRFEASPYKITLQKDIQFINNIKSKEIKKLNIEEFQDLKEIEGLFGNNIGANSLFALESSVLKALAKEQSLELWELLCRTKKPKFPMPVGNAVGGGLHSRWPGKKPDFQEFLFIPKTKKFSEAVEINDLAYRQVGEKLNGRKKTDEGAWQTSFSDEKTLGVLIQILEKIGKELRAGVDFAASTFYKNSRYYYKNPKKILDKKQQEDYIKKLMNIYDLFYLEDPLQEGDFSGFNELKKKLKDKTKSIIVGDDLVVTNLLRLKKAIQKRAVDAIIVKPNQNGSLLKVKEICDFCKRRNIKIVFSHRSGETLDSTIADLALAWKAEFIKTGIFGKERKAKLSRLVEIEKRVL